MRLDAPDQLVQPCGHPDDIVVEETRTDVERHRSRSVPEHPLHRPDIGPGRHGQRGGGVPQLMRCEPHQTNSYGGVEDVATPVQVAEHAAAATCEDQIVRRLAN